MPTLYPRLLSEAQAPRNSLRPPDRETRRRHARTTRQVSIKGRRQRQNLQISSSAFASSTLHHRTLARFLPVAAKIHTIRHVACRGFDASRHPACLRQLPPHRYFRPAQLWPALGLIRSWRAAAIPTSMQPAQALQMSIVDRPQTPTHRLCSRGLPW